MNAASLLDSLSSRGIVLTNLGGEIQAEAPRGTITDSDIEAIRQHKPKLLSLLAIPTSWGQYGDAIARAFAIPTPREEIGPLWMTDPDGWDLFEPDSPGAPRAPRQQTTRTPGICDRCGSDQHKDFPIHGGRSIRRDCGQCGRTLGFPQWQPTQEPRL